jgi:hypothetical protein
MLSGSIWGNWQLNILQIYIECLPVVEIALSFIPILSRMTATDFWGAAI